MQNLDLRVLLSFVGFVSVFVLCVCVCAWLVFLFFWFCFCNFLSTASFYGVEIKMQDCRGTWVSQSIVWLLTWAQVMITSYWDRTLCQALCGTWLRLSLFLPFCPFLSKTNKKKRRERQREKTKGKDAYMSNICQILSLNA